MAKVDQLKQVYLDLAVNVANLPLATIPEDIVPGEGNPDAELMFIGEAPGYYESVQHRPFVGKSGQLFRKTLIEEAKILEEEIYISNIVKVRPPDNRDPSVDEIMAYKPYLDKEINIIQPEIVVTLGRFSMAKFLADVKISQVHGRLHTVKWGKRRLFVLPMFHPAAALRQGKFRQYFIEDFKKLPQVLQWVKQKKNDYQLTDSVKAALW